MSLNITLLTMFNLIGRDEWQALKEEIATLRTQLALVTADLKKHNSWLENVTDALRNR